MAHNDPIQTKIFYLFGTDFTGESSIFSGRDVLSCNLNMRGKNCFGRCDVDIHWSNNYFYSVSVILHMIYCVVAKSSDEVNSAIALPVASDDVFSASVHHRYNLF